MKNRVRTCLALLPALCAGLTLTACGGGKGATQFTPASAGPVTAVAGCAKGWTDPSDLASDRTPARCDSATPAPVPLAKRTKIVISAATLNAEFIAPIRWALAKGEFEKENLDVEIDQVPAADGLNLLAQGKTDAMIGAPDAAFFNALNSGFGLRWVMGNFDPPPTGKSGIWARDVDGRPATMADLRGKPMASVLGTGSPVMYPIVKAAEKAGMSFSDLKLQSLPAADVVTSLENGGVQGAWVIDPLWTELANNPNLTFLGGAPLGEPIGGVLFGPNLLGAKRAAGDAFVRAVARTINTAFRGDYKNDPTFTQQLSKVVGLPVSQLTRTPSLIMDWEIRDGTAQRIQDALIKTKAVSYPTPITETQVVDRSFYEKAVGHQG